MLDLNAAPYAAFRNALLSLTPLTTEELRLLGEGCELRRYARRECIQERGKICRNMGFVLSGAVRYFYEKEGMEITNYFTLENEWTGAYQSFLKQVPSQVNVQALEDTQVVTISHDQLLCWEAMPRFAPKISELFRRLAEHVLDCYEQRVVSFVLDSPEERYLKLLAESPDVLQRIPQQYVANFLGITPVSLSRMRRRIQH